MRKKGIAFALILAIVVTILSLTGCLGSSVTISFNSMGGSAVTPVKVAAETESLALPTPTRVGYTFDYWCYDFACTEMVDPAKIPTENVTFYAKWTQQLVTVTFLADDSRQFRFVPYGESLPKSSMPPVPEKEGYVGRWLTGDLNNVTAPVTIRAEYVLDTYSVVYMVEGSPYFADSGSPGDAVDTPTDPEISGAVFVGWYSDEEFLHRVKPVETISTSSVVLYARVIYVSDMSRYFYYEVSGGEATITGLSYLGRMQNTIIVPESLGGYPVTAIGEDDGYAVISSVNLQTLYIPSSVRKIGALALSDNPRLNDLVIKEGLTTIGDCAFVGCSALSEVVLPASVVSVGDFAFAGIRQDDADDLVLPGGGYLDDMAWTSAESSLTDVTFAPGSRLQTLGRYTFFNSAVTSFTVPDSEDYIPDHFSFAGSEIAALRSECPLYPVLNDVLYSSDGKTCVLSAPKCATLILSDETTRIASYAFYDSSATAVIIPASVVSLGDHAFERSAVTSIEFADGSSLSSIGDYAFLSSALSAVDLPSSVTSIGTGAFKNTALTYVNLSNTDISLLAPSVFEDCANLNTVALGVITSIGDHAFYNCRRLANVSFPQTRLQSIGDYAFADCLNLKTVTFSSVTSFGDYAFAGISGRSSAVIDIPRTTVHIGDYAFMNTSTTVYNPNTTSLQTMGVGAFKNCVALSRANISQSTYITALPDETFYGCSRLNNITVNGNIRSLGKKAFYGCTNLTSVTFKTDNLGNGVTEIKESCFENCTSLGNGGGETRILPLTLQTLGNRAFYNCSSLSDITIPEELTKVASEAFAYCSSLSAINYDNNCQTDTLEENCFAFCTSLVSVTLPKMLSARTATTGAVKNPFLGCSSLTSLNVLAGSVLTAVNGIVYLSDGPYRKIYLYPTGKTGEFEVDTDVVAVDDYAFYGARLDSITFLANPIEDGKEAICFVNIGDYAFAESSVTSAILTNRIRSVGRYAFAGSALSSLYVDGTIVNGDSEGYVIQNGYEDNLISIGERAFANTKLTLLSIPARVRSLDTGAFADCYVLSTVEFLDATTSGLTLSIGDRAFADDVAITGVSFPVQIVNIGDRAFDGCHNVSSITFDDSSAVSIGKYAFKDNQYLYSVTLPSSLTAIGEGVFYGCSRLVDASLPNVALDIPAYAFYGCFALRELSVPYDVTGIGDYAFTNARLVSLTFSNGSSGLSIGKYAFAGSTDLKHIVFPDNLVLIDEYAFSYSSIESFEYGNAVFTIKANAFSDSALTELVLNENVTLDGSHIFAYTSGLVSLVSKCSVITPYAFYSSGIQTVEFLDLDEVGEWAFAETYNLSGLDVDFAKPVRFGEYAFYFSALRYVNISASELTVDESAFMSDASLYSVTVNAATYSLGQKAFARADLMRVFDLTGYAVHLGEGFAMGCGKLESISVASEHGEYYTVDGVVYGNDGLNVTLLQYPAGKYGSVLDLDDTVTNIAEYAFCGNAYLNTITIRSSTDVSAEEYAFAEAATDLTVYVTADKIDHYKSDARYNVKVSVIATEVGEFVLTLISGEKYALSGYTGTSNVININGIMSDSDRTYRIDRISRNAFRNNKDIVAVTVGNGIKEINDYAFAGCVSLASVVLGNNVETIGAHAFDGCVLLDDVRLNNEITTIGEYAFAFCPSLASITLPAKLVDLGSYAFKNDTGLETLDIPSLVNLGDCAFEGATSLVSIRFPNNLKFIGNNAFRGCDDLSFIYLTSGSVVRLNGLSALGGAYDGRKILVAERMVPEYCSDSTWRYFADGILSYDKISGNYLLTDLNDGTFRLDAYLGTESNVVIDHDATLISEIGQYCFGRFCTDVTLNGVKTVDDGAFIYATNLVAVRFVGVTTIGDDAFSGLTKLASVDFGSDLVSIGNNCFIDCFRLTSLTFPSKLVSIGDYAFSCIYSNMKLKNVVFNAIASTSLSIGCSAFADNDELETLTFNCFVNSIGDYAFSNCVSLSSVYLNYNGTGATAIAEEAAHVFENCDKLSIFVPTVEKRREYLQTWHNNFDKNRLLLSYYVADDYVDTDVTIEQDNFVIKPVGDSGSVASIVNYLGDETEVVFPSTVVVENGASRVEYQIDRIGRDDNNSIREHNGRVIGHNVTKVVIPSSVRSISGDAFRGAQSLREVAYENGSILTNIGNYAFADCPALTTVSLPKSVTNIGNYAFAYDSSLTSFDVEEFLNAEIDKTTLTIGGHAFDGCVGLQTVTMPKHLASIGTYAFANTSGLRTVIFPADCAVASFDTYAFAASGLTTITLPASIGSVGNYAFANCASLKSVHLTRTTANYSSITTTYDNVFYGIRSAFVKVYVPETMYAQYGNSAGWSTKTVVPDLFCGDYNYRRTSNTVTLTGYLGSDKIITIPASLNVGGTLYRVTTISSYFGNDTLEEVYFEEGSSISTLDRYAFAGCTSLRKIRLSDAIQNVGENAFQNCTALTDVTLSASADKIPAYAFDGCTSLKEITLPASVKEIGNAAFQNCSSLYRIVIEFSVTSNNLGLAALSGTAESLVIIVPDGKKDSFANQWADYKDIIYDRKQLIGDFVISDDGHGGYVLEQYCGQLDLDLTEKTLNGRPITSIDDNAVIYDVTITGMDI